MNKRERVLCAMNNGTPDHTPVGFWFHFPAGQASGDACIQAHLDYYNTIDADLVKVMCDGYFDYPNPVAKAAANASDWRNLRPLGKDSDFIRAQVERAKRVRDGLKDERVVLYNVFAPFSSIRFGTSDELVMRHLKEDPDAVRFALDIIAEDNAALCELLIKEAGIDGVYYCVQGGEKGRMTCEEYRCLVTPSDKAVLEHANKFSDNNVLHCCGWAGIQNNVEVWSDYPAKVINWAVYVENLSIADGRELFGGKPALGGFDNRKTGLLFNGTKDEIQNFTYDLINKCGKSGIILGADCTLPGDIDKQRIEWVIEAARCR